MRSEWGDKEVGDSARQIAESLSLHNTLMRGVSEYFRSEEDAAKVLGDIFTALRREHPVEYSQAFKRAVDKRCKDCGERAKGGRGYCRTHYQKHRLAGDFDED